MISEETTWWEPEGALAFAVALLSTACWGSWSNTAKAAGDRVNFAHYYTDFCIGTVVTAVLFLLGPGARVAGEDGVDLTRSGYALAAGGLFGIANLLLTTGIALAGLSIAFPLCIGTGLVGGTILTYIVDRRGQATFIFVGVFIALLGVLANARAYGLLHVQMSGHSSDSTASESEEQNAQESASSSEDDDKGAAAKRSFGRDVTLCVVGGVLMSLWAPLSAKSMEGTDGLSPYASFVCFTVASMLVGLLIISGQQCGCSVMPRVGPVVRAGEYFQVAAALHCWGWLGGAIWALGTISNLVSGRHLGFALSYALGQTAPVVAVIWGLAWYREFDGAPRQSKIYLALMFVFFITAIAMLCYGGK